MISEFENIFKKFLLVQFIINCKELEKSSKDFSKNVEDKLTKPDDMKKQARLKKIRSQIQGLGSDLRGRAEIFVGEQISTKIDTYFEVSWQHLFHCLSWDKLSTN